MFANLARDIAVSEEEDLSKEIRELAQALRAGAEVEDLESEITRRLEPEMGADLAKDLSTAMVSRARTTR